MTSRRGKNRAGIYAALDVGSSKICCFIARSGGEDELPRIIGIGQQVSRGVRNGAVVDMDQAQRSITAAVHAAEEMAGETLEQSG